ncbi:MAG: hypothetical protein JRG70_16740 [Deltaproteobacteria bacterium]|nr:hypothetical protein [Deltaproteobacteria bacterium]
MARGNLERHEIFLSSLRVRVQSSCTQTNRYLQRHWSAAKLPILPPEACCDIEVIADASPRIVVDGEVVWADGIAEDLVAGFEQWLYRAALAQHEGRFAVFHASALVSDGATVVFSGPSGAGKSSLALAAARRGWKYFSDEFVVTDGQRVWGWPRAIRFDPPEPGAPFPDYLVGLDTDYDAGMSQQDAGPPYYAVSGNALQRVACSAHEVRFVSVERGTHTTLERISTSVGLKHWTEAAFFEPAMSLGALVGVDRTWRASWRRPEELIELIAAT